MSDKDKHSFESALAELEELVHTLEKGELPLEQTLAQFERGIALTRRCQKELQAAEQKVEILLKKTTDAEPQDFGSKD
ncbi:MAG: exodeoxyribonuclease VII small subunit [Gammaproteobacteria bacterium]|nr:exodeoxyribonuclease VII small subunit [Gammaproteobacteria bacterium]